MPLQAGPLAILIGSLVFVTGQFYLLYVAPISPLLHAIFFVCFLISIAFLSLPMKAQGRAGGRIPWHDWLLAAAALIPLVYALQDFEALVTRSALPDPTDVWVGLLLIALLLESTRRAAGWVLPGLAFGFIVIATFNHFSPVTLDFLPSLSLRRVVGTLVIAELGVFSEVTHVAIKWIFIFLVFGQCLLLAGGQQMFTELSFKLTGQRKGGPAYVACVSSALFGTLSGSNMANVMTTGQFTIPLMKGAGYRPSTAAAIESVASTGGALTPPVMAAGALILAELTGNTYLRIIEAAIIPAILFYLSVFVYTWGITQRSDIRMVEVPANLRSYPQLLRDFWPVALGLGYLIYRIVTLYPLELAAFEASAMMAVGAVFTNRAQLRRSGEFGRVLMGLINGIRDTGLCCACSGIIVGVILVTGIGVELSNLVTAAGQTSLVIPLLLTMLVTIVLGMGVPGIAAYVIAASVIATSLTTLGISALSAHLFIFYFSLFAGITPPVALTAFAAAGLAKADPFRTAFEAMVIALPTYFVAFFFVYQPELLMEGSGGRILWSSTMAALGVTLIALGTSGFLIVMLGWVARLTLVVAGVSLVHAHWQTDLVGLCLSFLVFGHVWRRRAALAAHRVN